MNASDIMTPDVISADPDATVLQAARYMLQHHISGLPVIDKTGNLVGILSEGDFLRRRETGTERRPSRWLEFLMGPGKMAVVSHEFLCKGVSQGTFSKAPANSTTLAVATLRRYSMAGMKIIHGCQPPPEASRRHNYIHAGRKVLLDFFCGVTDSVSGHDAILREKLLRH